MTDSILIQTIGADTACLVFECQGDRWYHQIRWAENGAMHPMATSNEGSAEMPWPPSPPIQELTEQELGERSVLLGVGMAGRSHWSISCSSQQDDNGSRSILVDIACLAKSREEIPWLGSTYKLPSDVDVNWPDSECSRLQLRRGAVLLELEAQRGDDWGTLFEIENGMVRIIPEQHSTRPNIPTRWAYAIRSRLDLVN